MPKSSSPPADTAETVLVLQGGGALGAYQAGVYQALAETAHTPDWIAGISIGAINGALIAGNAPDRRVDALRGFWDRITSRLLSQPLLPGERARSWFNEASAGYAALFGLPGFFEPRLPPAPFFPAGAPQALSVYRTDPLRETLEEFVDFDLLNSGHPRLAVGAVNVRTGNFVYFDSARREIGPEHIMASSALPPGFPPVEVDGELYWDGGLVSNTPLQYVLDTAPDRDMLIFQVDLFSARGPLPRDLPGVYEREKDIRYSSRTRLNTDVFRREQALRQAARRLVDKLPKNLRDDPDAALLRQLSRRGAVSIVHLINRRKAYFAQSKDYEFSRLSMQEHWQDGMKDVRRTLRHSAWLEPDTREAGAINVFDLTLDAED